MDSRDTQNFYARRQAGNPPFEPYKNTGLLLATCLIVIASLFGVMMYEIVTELYL